ncbi:MAG TPA: DUF2911 domain-containing protein [Blastocatellia bacterium]|nr:DUF2911 domain-containing protein [Blastocatellia bacterium]
MKTVSSLITLAALLLTIACARGGATSESTAGPGSPAATADPAVQDRGQAELAIEGGKVSVEYGRPTLRGRNIEALIQPGDEWRMGSNNATTLTTDTPLKFGDKVIDAGKYILKAKLVEPKKWHLLIETQDHTPVAELPLELQRLDNSIEALTINLEKKEKGGRLIVSWGNLSLFSDFQKSASA